MRTSHRLHMTHTVAHRAQTVQRAPVRRAEGDVPAFRKRTLPPRPEASKAERKPAALTRRERKVKDLLLRELRRSSDARSLTYAEKQHLEKTLSVDFIDKELAKMHRQYRRLPWMLSAGVLLFGGFALAALLSGWEGDWGELLMLVPILLSGLISPFIQRRALRRKIFIYESLRALSDANEVDVVLSKAVEQADDLIRAIVDRELAYEAA